jgi:hypothetical protein
MHSMFHHCNISQVPAFVRAPAAKSKQSSLQIYRPLVVPPANSVDSPEFMLGTISLLLSDICSPARAERRQAIPRLRVYQANRLPASLDPKTVSSAELLLSHAFALRPLIRISKPLASSDALSRKDVSAVSWPPGQLSRTISEATCKCNLPYSIMPKPELQSGWFWSFELSMSSPPLPEAAAVSPRLTIDSAFSC